MYHPLAATGRIAVLGGLLSLLSLVLVAAGELTQGTDAFMASTSAKVSGIAGFIGIALMAVGLPGLAVRYVDHLGRAGCAALGWLGFATAISAGAAGTLGLVVPWVVGDYPDLGVDPPAVVPPTFILGGLVMGVAGIVIAVALRKVDAAPVWQTRLLLAGSLLTMSPLPARHFLIAIAVGVLVAAPRRARVARSESVEAGV